MGWGDALERWVAQGGSVEAALAGGATLLGALLLWFGIRRGLRVRSRTPAGLPAGQQNYTVRVFISSTFIDMQRERDVLVRQTFPTLRAKLRARGVELLEVDLRWGVREEDVESGRTLPICLAEVDRCKPYFIGLLGDRYGSLLTDDKITPELRERFPSASKGIGRSLTELEILHGVLARRDNIEQALFFERDPKWGARLDPAERAALPRESNAARRKLSRLKARIRRAGPRIVRYAAPDDIGGVVERALGDLLDRGFPAAFDTDAWTQTQRLHDAYARERCSVHVAAESYSRRLTEWRALGAPLCVVTGVSGAGKSALLANWTQALSSEAPDEIVFTHFLGASPDSADPTALIRRLWEFLNRATNETIDAPSDDEALVSDFPQRLAVAALAGQRRRARILIVLDGLDKLSDQSDLRWLPSFLPAGVQVLASSLEGKALQVMRARGAAQIDIVPLSPGERRELIDAKLHRLGRKLAKQRIERIVAHTLAGAPLFVITLIDELRVSATNNALDRKLDFYLSAQEMADFFARFIERLHDESAPETVKRVSCLIWASRAGLEEADIIVAAGVSPLDWAVLRNSFGDALWNQTGRMTFSHDFLRQAIERRFLSDPQAQRGAHLMLADYVATRPNDRRRAEELPFQLERAGEWSRLEGWLCDLDNFDHAYERGAAELLSYWLHVKRECSSDPEDALCAAFARRCGEAALWNEADIALAFNLGRFLVFAGARGPALKTLLENCVAACERLHGAEAALTLNAHNALALTLVHRGEREPAEALRRRVLDARERTLGPEHPDTLSSLSYLAASRYALGDIEEAASLQARALDIRRRTLGAEHADTLAAENSQAVYLADKGEFELARSMHQHVVDVRSRRLGADHPSTLIAMSSLSNTLRKADRLQEAEALGDSVLAARERMLGPEHPSTLRSLSRLSQTAAARGDLERALTLEARALAGRRRVLGSQHPDTLASLHNMAAILAGLGRSAEAVAAETEVVIGRERSLGADHAATRKAKEALEKFQLAPPIGSEKPS